MSKEEQEEICQKCRQNHRNQRNNQSQTTPSVSATTQVSSQYNCNQTVASTTSDITTPTVQPSTANPTPSQAQAQRFLAQADQTPSSVVFGGRTYVLSVTNISYRLNKHKTDNSVRYSLIDRGANGGLSGDDVRVLEMNTSPTKQVDVTGIAGAKVSNVPLKTVAGVIQTTSGPIIGIFHNYAHHGEGHTIHSPLQLEAFGNTVDNPSRRLQRGTQQITTLNGHVIPLVLKSGLFYMSMYPPSDRELEEFPHVTMTSA